MSVTYYIKQGNTFSVTDSQNIDIHDHLPAGTYLVQVSQERGFYLCQTETMIVPNKIYGPTETRVGRIYNTFINRGRNTGVLLNGEKGAGKTLTLSLLSHEFIRNGLPVIIINNAFCGDAFNKFICEISQPCMIAFDEFDKTYDEDDQQKILTLLDGVFNSNKLFVLTCNNQWKINQFMLNRPGRIFYSLSYSRMDEDAIRQYCEDNLDNKEHIEGVCIVASTIDAFNFDMLKAIVEEMNRYKETAKQAIQMLNIRPERSGGITYKYLISRGGDVLYTGELHNSINPLGNKPFAVEWNEPNPQYDPSYRPADESEDVEDNIKGQTHVYGRAILSYKEVTRIDTAGYVFEKDGVTVTIVRESEPVYSYGDYF